MTLLDDAREHATAALFDGERVLESWAANARPVSFLWGRQLVVYREGASGGALLLTNYRLLFWAHALNFLKGHFSVFLPTVLGVEGGTVRTPFCELVFEVSDRFTVEARIRAAREALAPEALDHVRALVRAEPDKLGEGLHAFWRSDLQGVRAEDLETIAAAYAKAADPDTKVYADRSAEQLFGLMNAVSLLHPELFDHTEKYVPRVTT